MTPLCCEPVSGPAWQPGGESPPIAPRGLIGDGRAFNASDLAALIEGSISTLDRDPGGRQADSLRWRRAPGITRAG
jgi:hypothetical protein